MTDSEIMGLFQKAAGDENSRPWDEAYLYGFFQGFRPDGLGLEELFSQLPEGDAVFARVRSLYAATAADFIGAEHKPAYFLPPLTSDDRDSALVLLKAHLCSLQRIAVAVNPENRGRFGSGMSVSFEGVVAPPVESGSLDGEVYELVGDWWGEIPSERNLAHLLWEAFYSIACDQMLALFLVWPWLNVEPEFVDPFKPYFDLWLRGYKYRLSTATHARLYPANGA